jgi:hypothetical protein
MTLSIMGILANVAEYIEQSVGRQDWEDHIHTISSYLAAGLEMPESNVINALKILLHIA